jgi:hypothetical protein
MLVALAELWAFYGILARVPAEIVTNIPNTALCLLVVLLVAWRRAAMRAYLVLLGAMSAFIAAFAVGCAVARADNIEAIIAVVGGVGVLVGQLARPVRAPTVAEPKGPGAQRLVDGQLGPYHFGLAQLDALRAGDR